MTKAAQADTEDGLRSCDTFVFVAGPGGPAATIFGKNSDRPSEESHEVVYVPAGVHAEGSTVMCTHIEIPQARSTLGVVLSKPQWMWGCEMGANELGVVGGNEAVHSMMSRELGSEARLLGMDLLRLALERGCSAYEAATTCATLLEAHGQGGGCAQDDYSWTYENGFLFADSREAWVLETAGVRCWALERVPPGQCRNISNGLSIRTVIHTHSPGLRDECRRRNWWDGQTEFDWKRCLGAGGRPHASLAVSGRERAGGAHMARLASETARGALPATDARAWVKAMAGVLRDEGSGICFRDLDGFCSTGSQVSWLPAQGGARHFFTGASDPLCTAYKEFSFASAPAHTSDLGTRELWAVWRDLALRGLATSSSALREAVADIEGLGLARLDECAESFSGGDVSGGDVSGGDVSGGDAAVAMSCATFEELVALELQAVARAAHGEEVIGVGV